MSAALAGLAGLQAIGGVSQAYINKYNARAQGFSDQARLSSARTNAQIGTIRNKTNQSQFELQKSIARTQGKIAEFNAKTFSLGLTEDYNRQMASDVVVAAAQNRRGATVQSMANSAEDQLAWDISYAELEGQMQASGKNIEAMAANPYDYYQEGYVGSINTKNAGDLEFGTGLLNAGLSAGTSAIMYNQIGSKDKPKTTAKGDK